VAGRRVAPAAEHLPLQLPERLQQRLPVVMETRVVEHVMAVHVAPVFYGDVFVSGSFKKTERSLLRYTIVLCGFHAYNILGIILYQLFIEVVV